MIRRIRCIQLKCPDIPGVCVTLAVLRYHQAVRARRGSEDVGVLRIVIGPLQRNMYDTVSYRCINYAVDLQRNSQTGISGRLDLERNAAGIVVLRRDSNDVVVGGGPGDRRARRDTVVAL